MSVCEWVPVYFILPSSCLQVQTKCQDSPYFGLVWYLLHLYKLSVELFVACAQGAVFRWQWTLCPAICWTSHKYSISFCELNCAAGASFELILRRSGLYQTLDLNLTELLDQKLDNSCLYLTLILNTWSLTVAKKENPKAQRTSQGSNGYNQNPSRNTLAIYKAEWKTPYLYICSM